MTHRETPGPTTGPTTGPATGPAPAPTCLRAPRQRPVSPGAATDPPRLPVTPGTPQHPHDPLPPEPPRDPRGSALSPGLSPGSGTSPPGLRADQAADPPRASELRCGHRTKALNGPARAPETPETLPTLVTTGRATEGTARTSRWATRPLRPSTLKAVAVSSPQAPWPGVPWEATAVPSTPK